MRATALQRVSIVAVLSCAAALPPVAARAQTAQTQTVADAAALRQQAVDLANGGKPAEAIPVAERAAALLESLRGADAPELPDYLSTIGRIHFSVQNFSAAATVFQRELDLRQRIAPSNEGPIAVALGNLATAKRGLGQLVDAQTLLERALAIQERLFGANDVRITNAITNIGGLQTARGDLPGAQASLSRAVKIFETQGQTETPGFAQLLNNLGALYFRSGEFDKAREPFERSLAIRQRLKAPPADIVRVSANLATLYQETGEIDRAEPLARQVLEIYDATPSTPPLDIATVSNNLAMMRLLKGDPAGAAPLYDRALKIRESVLGPNHTDVATTLEKIAVFDQATNKPADALRDMTRATTIIEANLRSVLVSGSEQQRLNYMTTLQDNTDIALSLRQAMLGQNAEASAWAATLVLRRKGRVLDAMTSTMDRLGSRVNADDRAVLKQLADARGKLAQLVLQPGDAKPGERQQQAAALQAEIDKIESTLSSRSREIAAELQPVELSAVQQQIPTETALIEFVRYRPFDPKAIGRNNRFGAPQYAVFVLQKTGAPAWTELGPAAAIETQVAKLRTALRSTSGSDPRLASSDLAKLLIAPIESRLGSAKRLLIASDGELSVIPFAALQDARGKFLIERFEIDNLASGRDLLRLADRQPSRSQAVVVANPNFDAGAAPAPAGAISFKPLAGTAQEADAIKAYLPSAQFLGGDAATEHSLKQVTGPRVLHVATHGFFLNTTTLAAPAAGDARGVTLLGQPGDAASAGRFALLRSGLALAGANKRQGGDGEDGLLTALEAASLDLRGTELVVLSACETGLGEVRSGDGVYGLRRALAVAGAETQVMSLWQVSDEATRDLMIAFYKRLAAKDGRAAALRAVQLQFLKSKTHAHPYYWAAFVVAGDWTPLRTN
jgi:CHAT domain-containing protein/Tfp pilus assembly protein PilF